MFSIVNELRITGSEIGLETAMSWTAEAYETIRNVTGYGKGNGPYIVLHDGFLGLDPWNGFLAGTDRVAVSAAAMSTRSSLPFSPSPAQTFD